MPNGFELEVCVDRIDTAILAAEAGATRIEFNCALELGGLSPSPASCSLLVKELSIPVVAMLRPHDRGFVYSDLEKVAMLRDAATIVETGVHGLVFGCLNASGDLDTTFIKKLVGELSPLPVIFHRAFDECQDQLTAMEQLVEIGIERILTSGGAESVWNGRHRLKELQRRASGRIEILPGCGVQESNAAQILEFTGCTQLHGSFGANATHPQLDSAAQSLSKETRRFVEHVGSMRKILEANSL